MTTIRTAGRSSSARRAIKGLGLLACAALAACGQKATVLSVVNTADQSVAIELVASGGGESTFEVPSGTSASLTRSEVESGPLVSLDQGVTLTARPESGQGMMLEMDGPGPYYVRITGAGGFIRVIRDQAREVDPFDRADPRSDPRRSQPGFTPAQRRY